MSIFVKCNNEEEYNLVAEKMVVETGIPLWEHSHWDGIFTILGTYKKELILHSEISKTDTLIQAQQYLSRD